MVPPNYVNPLDAGVVGDNVADDTTALQALIDSSGHHKTIYLPPAPGGMYFCGSDLHLTRTINLVGCGPARSNDQVNDGTGGNATTLRFAAGHGLIVDGAYTAPGGFPLGGGSVAKYADYSRIEKINFVGAVLTLPEWPGAVQPVVGGAKIHGTNENRYFYECLFAGTTAGVIPDFTFGYFPDMTVLRTPSATVGYGVLVRDLSTSKLVFWQCTKSGVTNAAAGGAPPGGWDTTIGNFTTDGTAIFKTIDAGGTWITDGTAVWTTRIGAGIFVRTHCDVSDCRFYQFTNSAIHLQASGGWSPPTNANECHFEDIRSIECGGGITIRGSDANACLITNASVTGPGFHLAGAGGVGLWDGSFLGCHFLACNVEGSSGPGYILGRYNLASGDNPIGGTMFGCYMEADCPPCTVVAGGLAIGGNIAHNQSLVISSGVSLGGTGTGGCNNLTGIDHAGPKQAIAINNEQGSGRMWLCGNDDNASPGYYLSLATYESASLGRPGWWSRSQGGYVGRSFSGILATEGRGWDWQHYGEYHGGILGSFSGQYFVAFDQGTMASPRVRSGEATPGRWQTGDRVQLKDVTYAITEAGFRAPPWAALGAAQQPVGGRPDIVPSTVEPTANGVPIPTPGGKVFRCSVSGTTGAVEPNWAPAVVVDVDTVLDGTVTWLLIGHVPLYIVEDSGQFTQAMADANQTLSAFQAAAVLVNATGVLTADRTLFFPAPASNTDAYERTVRASVTGGFNLRVDVVGGVAPITVRSGSIARIGFDAEGAFLITSDGVRTVATADATPTFATLATLAVGDVRQVDVIAKVAKADGTTRQVFKLSALYYGAAGPTATIDGSVGAVATGTGAAAVTLDTSGALVRLKITGVAATNFVTTYEAHVL